MRTAAPAFGAVGETDLLSLRHGNGKNKHCYEGDKPHFNYGLRRL
jgi:hypothetical protein